MSRESPRRIVIARAGASDALEIEEFETTHPAPGHVTIEVEAIGLNFADVFCRLGLYAAAPSIPFVPGFELAGLVTEVAEDVAARARAGEPVPNVGDRVIGLTRFGAYTTRIHLPVKATRPLPGSWTFEQGAAFPVVFLTAWHGLIEIGRLAAGETVVVQSAAGGVGTAACQIARRAGARVLGTVGSEDKRPTALEAGARHVVVSRRYRVWPEIDRLTGGEGVDLVFDAVGGRGLRHGYDRLRLGGRLVVYGFAEMMPRRGVRNWPLLAWRVLRMPRFQPFGMTATNRTVAGFNLVFLWETPDLFQRTLDALFRAVEEGGLAPVVGSVLPFERVGEAHELLQSRKSRGKVVLRVRR